MNNLKGLNVKAFLVTALYVLLICPSWGQSTTELSFSSSVLVSIPWGSVSQLQKVFHQEEFNGFQVVKSTHLFPPTSLRVDKDNNFYFRQGKKYYSFSSKGGFRWVLEIPSDKSVFVRDFDVDEPDMIYALFETHSQNKPTRFDGRVGVYSKQGSLMESYTVPENTKGGFSRIFVSSSDFVIQGYGNYFYKKLRRPDNLNRNKFLRTYAFFDVGEISSGKIKGHKLKNLPKDKFHSAEINFKLPESPSYEWRRGEILGFSRMHSYVLLGKMEAGKPETKGNPSAFIGVIGFNGKLGALIDLHKEYTGLGPGGDLLTIDDAGTVYELSFNDLGIQIIQWNFI